MSTVQPQQLLDDLLTESCPAQPTTDADLIARLEAQLAGLRQKRVPVKRRLRISEIIFWAAVYTVFGLAIVLGLLRLSEWVSVALDPPASSARQAAPPAATPYAPAPQQQPVVNVYLTTPVPQPAPEPTPDDGNDPSVPAGPIGERPNLNPGPSPVGTDMQPAPAVNVGERVSVPPALVVKRRPGGRANLNSGPGVKP